MGAFHIVTIKLAEDVYQELSLRVPEGERSDFIRDAINEKLQKTPRPDILLALQERMSNLEEEFGQIKISHRPRNPNLSTWKN